MPGAAPRSRFHRSILLGLYDVALCHKEPSGADGNEIILIVIQLDPGHHHFVSRFQDIGRRKQTITDPRTQKSSAQIDRAPSRASCILVARVLPRIFS